MGRSAYQYRVRDLKEAKEIAEGILVKNRFSQKTLRSGELVWVKGNALIISQQFVSLYFIEEEKTVLIYAWLQGGFGIPGMGEKEVEGLGAALPRKMLNKTLLEIQNEFERIRL